KTILSGRKKVVHTDQLILPNTVRVDYVQEDFYHVITILMCTPIDQNNTRVFIRMATWYAYLTWLVGPFVKHLTNKVVKQDRIILKNQYQCIDTFGRKPHIYVQADWPSKMMLKCMDLNSRGEFHPDKVKEADVSFKL
ncbi:MAG: hypothetical protein OEW87_14380, partial [Flavobacteriaceae bacterium]|nr:hypothetical protein [Flavobacteriaceae bacterium]